MSQKLSPPSPSTKPEARKDKIVVEVKSDKLSEEAGLLQGANGERRAAADQVGQSDGTEPWPGPLRGCERLSGPGLHPGNASLPPPGTAHPARASIIHQQRSEGRGREGTGREGRGQSREVTKLCSVAVPAACPAWLHRWSSSQALPKGLWEKELKCKDLWPEVRAEAAGVGSLSQMSLLGPVLFPSPGMEQLFSVTAGPPPSMAATGCRS